MFCSVYAKIQNIDLLGCFSFLGWWWCSISLTPTLPRRLRSKGFCFGISLWTGLCLCSCGLRLRRWLGLQDLQRQPGMPGRGTEKAFGWDYTLFPFHPQRYFLEVKFHQKAKVASSWLQYQPFGTRTQYVSPTRWLQLTLGDRHLGHPSGIAVVSLL